MFLTGSSAVDQKMLACHKSLQFLQVRKNRKRLWPFKYLVQAYYTIYKILKVTNNYFTIVILKLLIRKLFWLQKFFKLQCK